MLGPTERSLHPPPGSVGVGEMVRDSRPRGPRPWGRTMIIVVITIVQWNGNIW